MNKIVKNASWIIICRIAQSVLALVINMISARYLGPSNFGLLTYAASLVAFVLPVMQLGFADTLVQEIIDRPEEEGAILGTSVVLTSLSAVVCILGVTSFSFVANPNETATLIVCFLYSLNLIFQSFQLTQYWYQAKLLSKYTSIVGLIAYTVVSIYKIFLLVSKKSVYWFALSNSFDYAIIAISILIIYKRLGGNKLSFSFNLGRIMFSRSKHYIISGIMVAVFAQTDKVMLKIMIDETATGLYGSAVAIAGVTSFVFSAIIDSFRPAILEVHESDIYKYEHRLTMLYSIVIYLALFQSLFITIFAKILIHVMYGAAYLSATSALKIIVWYTTFSYIGAVRNIWILSNNKQNYLWSINLSGALANVALNLFLIPRFGINGAALASLLTQFFTNVIIGYIIKDIRPNNVIMLNSLKPSFFADAVSHIRK